MLDLFDRRLRLFYAVVEAIRPIMAHGAVSSSDGEDRLREYIAAGRDARFLFGADVNDYLERLRKTLIGMHLSETMMKAQGQDHAKWVINHHDAMLEVGGFYERFPALCDPYLKMDQKQVRSPFRWLLDILGRGEVRPVTKPGTDKDNSA